MNLKLNTVSPTQIHLLGATLALTITGASAWAVFTSWKSRQSGIESSQLQLTQVTSQLSATQQQRGRLLNQISNLEAIVKEHEHHERPTSINQLAVKVVALAEEQHLQLQQFEPGNETIVNNDPAYPINIRVSAPFNSITTFLDTLHETMPDIHVVGLSLQSPNASSNEINTDIRLNWYIPTPPQPAP